MHVIEELTEEEQYFLHRYRALDERAKENVESYLRVQLFSCGVEDALPLRIYPDTYRFKKS